MATMSMRVTGLREIGRALQELPKATGKNVMKRVLMKRAEPLAEEARRLVPVDTGQLKRSITVSTRATGGDPGKAAFARAMRSGATRAEAARAARDANRGTSGTVRVFIGPGRQPHAHLQEFGTRHHGPQPYLGPAWENNKQKILDGISDDLWAEIRKAAARHARKLARKG